MRWGDEKMIFLFMIPVSIVGLAIFLAWLDGDASSWPDDAHEFFHKDLEDKK